MPRTAIKIGPKDHGRRMSLRKFDHAQVEEGYLYELSRGVITVSDVPQPDHMAVVLALRNKFVAYHLSHEDEMFDVISASDCKILLEDLESERHPDLSVYKTPPPAGMTSELWAIWIPELVIEVVSPGSRKRDYQQKPEEYLEFGVKEYWIVDPEKDKATVLRRSGGRWVKKVMKPGASYEPRLFPGLEIHWKGIFETYRRFRER